MSIEQISFTARLIEANNLDPHDFRNWVFYPGMCFNAPDKWWGDFGRRDFPHEGLDFCLYQDGSGRTRSLGEATRLPVIHDGTVRALFKDYLGTAVILEHENKAGGNRKLMSVYAHTVPEKGIVPGATVRAGDVIAAIADTRRSKAAIRPHLHLTFGYPFARMVYEPFVWDSMRDPRQVELLDPRSFIDWPCQVLESRHAP